jgi:hypothetical protein
MWQPGPGISVSVPGAPEGAGPTSPATERPSGLLASTSTLDVGDGPKSSGTAAPESSGQPNSTVYAIRTAESSRAIEYTLSLCLSKSTRKASRSPTLTSLDNFLLGSL